MKKLNKISFVLLALLVSNLLSAQDILDKLSQSQKDAKSTTKEGLEIFFGYMDIILAMIVAGWAVISWRASKRSDSEDGQSFNLLSFAMTKLGAIGGYILIRVVSIQLVS
ncbi:hypothetical protein [Chondrinema litorale]|uniref:hypothetical protein n=1 Tax=Chondrinema litorale TaxID=2994555 RepID=UPI0025429B84|nr:hypothetical protein [Chondrinema litorale]UZR98997.1 hypothetical protein OQ292_33915 [Chondrinema litorale]